MTFVFRAVCGNVVKLYPAYHQRRCVFSRMLDCVCPVSEEVPKKVLSCAVKQNGYFLNVSAFYDGDRHNRGGQSNKT